jgi:hypothetical protein
MWKCTPLLLVALLADAGCALIIPGHFWRIYGDARGVLLASDTPEVRQLIKDEDAREEEVSHFWREGHTREERVQRIGEMRMHPDRYPPGRSSFLSAMAQAGGMVVPSNSYCEVIEWSKSKCGKSPVETAVYVRVRVTTGRSRGATGWACNAYVKQEFP